MSDIPCPKKGCEGTIEASSKIYLDVTDAAFNEAGDLVIEEFDFSHVNDHYKGVPCNVEGELYVACTEGHEVAVRFGERFRSNLGAQPIGDAERTLGERGGM